VRNGQLFGLILFAFVITVVLGYLIYVCINIIL